MKGLCCRSHILEKVPLRRALAKGLAADTISAHGSFESPCHGDLGPASPGRRHQHAKSSGEARPAGHGRSRLRHALPPSAIRRCWRKVLFLTNYFLDPRQQTARQLQGCCCPISPLAPGDKVLRVAGHPGGADILKLEPWRGWGWAPALLEAISPSFGLLGGLLAAQGDLELQVSARRQGVAVGSGDAPVACLGFGRSAAMRLWQ